MKVRATHVPMLFSLLVSFLLCCIYTMCSCMSDAFDAITPPQVGISERRNANVNRALAVSAAGPEKPKPGPPKPQPKPEKPKPIRRGDRQPQEPHIPKTR